MKKSLFLCLIILLQVTHVFAQEKTPAFPSAEGYGKWATGGRGGKVVEVTNLSDDGTGDIIGSFRWALKQHTGQPITVVFRTSGIIDLKGKDLRCKRENYTIAGQTAPGDGICIKGGCVNLGGSRNVIIRHMRFRLGIGDNDEFISGACLNIENGGNFIIDHCSFSWSAEENVGFYDDDNITVQWSLIAEGLYNAGHGKGSRGYGAVLGGKTATYHHNLIAHNVSRAPRFGATTKNDVKMLLDYVNNVHYNWGGGNACYGGDNRQGSMGEFKINIVNNYYKPGLAYPGTSSTNIVRTSYYSGQGRNECHWHLDGNYIEGTANKAINDNNYKGLNIQEYVDKFPDITVDDVKSDHITVAEPVVTESAQDAYQNVLKRTGAFPRDSVDRRIINETIDGTAKSSCSFKNYAVTGIIDKPIDSGGYPEYNSYNFILDTDKDGIPDYWEKANHMNPENPDDRNLLSAEGYTYLEVYLNGLVGEYLEDFIYPEPEYISDGTSIPGITSGRENIIIFTANSGNTLKISSSDPVKSVTLFDLFGKKVFNQSTGNLSEINISSLPAGVYISLIQAGSNYTERVKFMK